jgi:predicted transcriptional regulator
MNDKMLSKPTDAELEILQVLWENGPSSVRFVNEQLGERKEVGYTTTLKLMQIMYEKGLVNRNTDARSHIYEAAIERDETQRNLLGTFVDNVFSGSAMSLVMQALGNHKASKDELDQIKALIEKMENEG